MREITTADYTSYYTVAHSDEFAIDWRAFYERADRMTTEIREALPHHLDIPYGDHPKQRLDVYRARERGAGPVFVFLHGGGFREGDRAHYGYVARRFADRGIVTVVPSYRLTPAASFPAQLDDGQALLEWVHRNIADYGGDPGFICISGHSAGAILSASLGANTRWLDERSLPADLVKAVVPISGIFDLTLREDLGDYVPNDAAARAASAVLNVDRPAARWLVAVGGAEEPYVEPSRLLVEKVREAGPAARLLVLEGMTHDQTAATLADADLLTESILDLFPAKAAA